MTKVLERFNMQDAKPVGLTLATNCKLNRNQYSKTKSEKVEMNKILYASTDRSLIYAMLCIRPNIDYVVKVVH